jgi:hypothetical protein
MIVIHDYHIIGALVHPEGELLNSQQKFLPSIFKAALARDKIKILEAIYHYWYFESDPKINKQSLFLDQMDPLVKEYEVNYPDKIYPE